MAVINMPAPKMLSDAEITGIQGLVEELSVQFSTLQPEDVNLTIAEALRFVGLRLGVEDCKLIEFDDAGTVSRVHAPAGTSTLAGGRVTPQAPESWLVARLRRGELVAISGPEEFPVEATRGGERSSRPATSSLLAVPVAESGHTICALLIESSAAPRRWQEPLVEGLRHIAEAMAVGLDRRRREPPGHGDVAAIERLNARLEADNRYLKEEIKTHHDFEEIVGESASLRTGLSRLSQVAPMNSTVLLLGPTGSGKELFARALHERSRRHSRPLVRVNCAALPPTLVESELFGHEKGAFTGAVGMRQGRFEMADSGTIFLDEIGDLAPDVQVKFLRVLQEGEFERVGSSRTRKVDVRVIAATHHDLEAAVAENRFRADLYYRLSVYPIRLPSLRERVEDIPRLVWFFINRHQRDLGRRIKEVPQRVMEALQGHSWPGNVRELENVIVRAMIASDGETLQLDSLLNLNKQNAASIAPTDHLDSVQRAHIESVLQRCGWRINGAGNAAECLGLHPNTLRFRIKKLGLSRPTAN